MYTILSVKASLGTVNNVIPIYLTKTTAAQNEVALSYHSVRGIYFLAVVFVRSIFTVQKVDTKM